MLSLPVRFINRQNGVILCLLIGLLSARPIFANKVSLGDPALITAVTVQGTSFCQGSEVAITMEVTNMPKKVQYNIYLSDAQGKYSSPKYLDAVDEPKATITLPDNLEPGTKYTLLVQAKDIQDPAHSKYLDSRNSGAFTVLPRLGKPVISAYYLCGTGFITLQASANCISDGIPTYYIELSDENGNFPGYTIATGFKKTGSITIPTSGPFKAGTYRIRLQGEHVTSEPSDLFTVTGFTFSGAPSLTNVPTCTGGTIGISFSAGCGGVFQANDPFDYTPFLSDAKGDFANPLQLLMTQEKPGLGTIELPNNLPKGQYRIKLRANGGGFTQDSPASAPFTVDAIGNGEVALQLSGTQFCSGNAVSVKIMTHCLPQDAKLAMLISDAQGNFTNTNFQPLEISPNNATFEKQILLVGPDKNTQQLALLPDGNAYKIAALVVPQLGTEYLVESSSFAINQATCATQPLQAIPKKLDNFSTTSAIPSATKSLVIQQANPKAEYAYGVNILGDYEISFDNINYGSGFFNLTKEESVIFKEHPMLVRLKAGLPAGPHYGLISVSIGNGTGEWVIVPLSGVVTVGNSNPNLVPVYQGSFTNQVVQSGSAVNFTLPTNAFSDPEGQSLVWSASGLPSGLTLSNQTIAGTANQPGTYPVTITATDPGGLKAQGGFTLTVNVSGGGIGGNFEGYLDKVECGSFRGWAWDAAKPNSPVTIEFSADGAIVGTTVASIFRDDLKNSGKGNGAHAYSFSTPASLKDGKPHLITAKVENTGFILKWAPKTLQCANENPNPGNPPVDPNPGNPPLSDSQFEGYLDKVECGTIRGWVWDATKPNTPVTIEFYTGNTVWGTTSANIYRPDLKDAKKGNGEHAYSFPVPDALKDGQSRLMYARVAGSSYVLKWSGKALVCPAGGRLSAELGAELEVRVLGNPVSEQVQAEVRGAEDQPLDVQLLDGNGRLVQQIQFEKGEATQVVTLDVRQQPQGLLLLRVSGGLRQVVRKIVKR
ncbi:putative Ig domain-containing protein [Larkinella terrae]|uniref:Dystroglycan-type cadherin-like domain-containing protein n=1 Tax=Larkinella terrae TaxID=2025311 RepID=A0A7K0ERA2_9BACT|nr:putative Ig domain-containing protein [Larkinella terrae]MRS64337.1 hypothetical protein [Larkinella terrae]